MSFVASFPGLPPHTTCNYDALYVSLFPFCCIHTYAHSRRTNTVILVLTIIAILLCVLLHTCFPHAGTMKILLLAALLHFGGALEDFAPVGQSFFLPQYDMLNANLLGGATLLSSVPNNCMQSTDVPELEDTQAFFKNTETLYSSITSSTSVSAELKGDYTLGVTLDAVTSHVSGSNRTVSGSTIMTYAYKNVNFITQDCLRQGQLRSNFKNDFERLSAVVTNPHLDSSWAGYESLLTIYGSHLVKKVTYGSSIYQYSFAEESEHYSEWNFTVSACVALAGSTDVGKVSVSACTGVTKEEAERSTSLKTSSRLILRGGTAETRAALYQHRSTELIGQFMLEADQSTIPVSYQYMSIWDLLKAKYLGTQHFVKAVNLEKYFLGFKAFGCPFRRPSGVELQKFVPTKESTPSNPMYHCLIAHSGCHKDSDCEWRPPAWCACYGTSCVRHNEVTQDTGVVKKVPVINTAVRWGWQGCTKKFGKCYCNHDLTPLEIWPMSADAYSTQYTYNSMSSEPNGGGGGPGSPGGPGNFTMQGGSCETAQTIMLL